MKNIKTFESYTKLYENNVDYSEIRKWQEQVDLFNSYNSINISIGKDDKIEIVECYISIQFDDIDSGYIIISMIPVDMTSYNILMKYFIDDEDINIGGGVFRAFAIKNNFFNQWITESDIKISLTDRKDAIKLKKILIDIFSLNIYNYPDLDIISEVDRIKLLDIINKIPINKMY